MSALCIVGQGGGEGGGSMLPSVQTLLGRSPGDMEKVEQVVRCVWGAGGSQRSEFSHQSGRQRKAIEGQFLRFKVGHMFNGSVQNTVMSNMLWPQLAQHVKTSSHPVCLLHKCPLNYPSPAAERRGGSGVTPTECNAQG